MIKERRYYFRKSVDSESVLCYNKARVKRQIMFPIYIYPPVAKLDIAADSDSEGRGFESLRAGQPEKANNPHERWIFGFFFLPEKSVLVFVWCLSLQKYKKSRWIYPLHGGVVHRLFFMPFSG